jgi:hypothetical protein
LTARDGLPHAHLVGETIRNLFRVGFALVVLAVAAPATAMTQNACLAWKLGAVGRTTAAALACHARDAAKPALSVLARCLDKVELRFTGGGDPSQSPFAKRERKPPCPTVGDQDPVGYQLFAFADALDHAVGNTVSRCDAAELACLGKYVAAAFGCLSRAATGAGVIDAKCLARAAAKLGDESAGCLAKAAVRADCSPGGGDAATLTGAADAFVAATLCELDPNGTSECSGLPTPVPTPTRTATPVATRTPTPVATGGSDDAA